MTTSDFPQYSREAAVDVLHSRVDKLKETVIYMDYPQHTNALTALDNLKDYISIVLLDCMHEESDYPSQRVLEERLV